MNNTSVLQPSFAQEFAQALLLEQVRFTQQQLLNSENNTYIKQFVHQVYQHADSILLKDIIQLQQLQQVVQKYAFELNLGADILEFIGVVAQKIHHYAVHSQTQFKDLLSDESFELWLYKILELEQVRHYIQENLQENPQIQHLSLQLANQILENNTPWLDHLRKINLKQHGLSARVLGFIQDQQQYIELKLEQQLAQVFIKQIGQIILLPNAELADISLHLWSDIKQRTLKETFSQFQSIDFEEFFILVYETWKELRQTEYMQQLILSVVEGFYEYFGEYTLQELLHSVGLNEDDLVSEALRFMPYSLAVLNEQGLLDDIIKSLIAPFYMNKQTHQFIENYLAEKAIK
ncbi:hypothetical protein [Acinetobacter sp. ANC 4648]|uniref:hypothetical protein n=1 Tax=Acinetobacter sp. ANC 4648 TaxID=1977875 RepID=UPI000A34B29D|nr:hypothetical protein [Acinetobacter sp. ANC 4648]OTG81764.1 hypothetical protein B9T27_10910 [Acinetobacter sp. ANC 4648]